LAQIVTVWIQTLQPILQLLGPHSTGLVGRDVFEPNHATTTEKAQ